MFAYIDWIVHCVCVYDCVYSMRARYPHNCVLFSDDSPLLLLVHVIFCVMLIVLVLL